MLTDPGAAPARPTNDIDLVVAVDTRIGYELVADRLRELGLVEDSTSNIICRWCHAASGTISPDGRVTGNRTAWAERWTGLRATDYVWKGSSAAGFGAGLVGGLVGTSLIRAIGNDD